MCQKIGLPHLICLQNFSAHQLVHEREEGSIVSPNNCVMQVMVPTARRCLNLAPLIFPSDPAADTLHASSKVAHCYGIQQPPKWSLSPAGMGLKRLVAGPTHILLGLVPRRFFQHALTLFEIASLMSASKLRGASSLQTDQRVQRVPNLRWFQHQQNQQAWGQQPKVTIESNV